MTTTFQFSPSQQAPFQFQPTLDGATYNAIVTWNLFGQRYYVSLYTLDGTLVFNLPLIGSEGAVNLASLSWKLGVATATLDTATPGINTRRYKTGSLVNLTVSGVLPDAYNGSVQASVQSGNSFSYPMPGSDPGSAVQLGVFSYDISLTAGYFDSTLVFRKFNNVFEVNP